MIITDHTGRVFYYNSVCEHILTRYSEELDNLMTIVHKKFKDEVCEALFQVAKRNQGKEVEASLVSPSSDDQGINVKSKFM